MSTIRVADRPKWTSIDRRAINDRRLSMRARGVLVWLLDKPDGWRADAETIARETTEGRDAIRAALNELKVAGYLVVTKGRDEAGRWATEQVLHELPQDGSLSELSDTSGADFQRRATSAGFPGPIEKTENEDCERPPSSSQRYSRPAQADRWREERNNPRKTPTWLSEWAIIESLASQGKHEWRHNPRLSPIARYAAFQLHSMIRGNTISAKWAFKSMWETYSAEGLPAEAVA